MAGRQNPFEFLTSAMKNMGMDRDTMIENQRKNIEAFNDMSKKAMEVMRSVSQMQQQYIKQSFDNLASMMKDAMAGGMTQETFKKNAESLKNHMTQSVDHGMTVASKLSESHKELYEKMKGQVTEHMKKAAEKKSSKHH